MKGCGWVVLLVLIFAPLSLYGEGQPDKEADETVTAREEPREFPEPKVIADPLEPWNRLVFFLNDRLYFALMKPVAQGYSIIVPEWGRVRIRNVFNNLKTPIRFVSSLLQLKVKAAGVELARFAMNSTIGFGGMFDVASQNEDLKGSDEDLGITLGYHGIGEGFFIMWPFLGPSSLRDSAGLAVESLLYPVNYITPFEDWFAVRSFQFENDVSLRIGEYEDLIESAVDPYVAMKDAYSEYRRSRIKEGTAEEVPGTRWPGR